MFTATSHPRVSIQSCHNGKAAHHHSVMDSDHFTICEHRHRSYGKAVECGKARAAADELEAAQAAQQQPAAEEQLLKRGDRVQHWRFGTAGTVVHASRRADDITVQWDAGTEHDGYTTAELEKVEGGR